MTQRSHPPIIPPIPGTIAIPLIANSLDKTGHLSKASKSSRKQKRRRHEAANRLRIRIRNLVDECHIQVAIYLTSHYKVILLATFETSQMVVISKRKLHT